MTHTSREVHAYGFWDLVGQLIPLGLEIVVPLQIDREFRRHIEVPAQRKAVSAVIPRFCGVSRVFAGPPAGCP